MSRISSVLLFAALVLQSCASGFHSSVPGLKHRHYTEPEVFSLATFKNGYPGRAERLPDGKLLLIENVREREYKVNCYNDTLAQLWSADLPVVGSDIKPLILSTRDGFRVISCDARPGSLQLNIYEFDPAGGRILSVDSGIAITAANRGFSAVSCLSAPDSSKFLLAFQAIEDATFEYKAFAYTAFAVLQSNFSLYGSGTHSMEVEDDRRHPAPLALSNSGELFLTRYRAASPDITLTTFRWRPAGGIFDSLSFSYSERSFEDDRIRPRQLRTLVSNGKVLAVASNRDDEELQNISVVEFDFEAKSARLLSSVNIDEKLSEKLAASSTMDDYEMFHTLAVGDRILLLFEQRSFYTSSQGFPVEYVGNIAVFCLDTAGRLAWTAATPVRKAPASHLDPFARALHNFLVVMHSGYSESHSQEYVYGKFGLKDGSYIGRPLPLELNGSVIYPGLTFIGSDNITMLFELSNGGNILKIPLNKSFLFE